MAAIHISLRTLRWLGGLLLLTGIGIRINNALRFRAELGFDAAGNLEYIHHLQSSWALPSPDSMWSASHPPFFYYTAAGFWRGLRTVGLNDWLLPALAVTLSIVGLLVVVAAVAMVRRIDPGDVLRGVVAGGLILFLPVHIYMSPMVGEEILLSFLVSLVLLGAAWRMPELPGPGETALLGLLCGLAMLTKLSGILVVSAVGATWLLAAWRSGAWRTALSRCALMGGVALVVGGWFYLYNWQSYGYLYAQDLPIHQKMFELPPGVRSISDYMAIPLATWTDPQLLNPDLLRSVWGSTYATIYFDGHRHFLPNSVAASRLGGVILALALIPTAAFLVGLVRGIGRALAEPGGRDTLLVAMVGISMAGYVAFTWGNPWFVTLKGSYLLVLCLPFAVYASEVLAAWIRGPGLGARAVVAALLALVVLVAAGFTLGPIFDKRDRGVRKARQVSVHQGLEPSERMVSVSLVGSFVGQPFQPASRPEWASRVRRS
jgi:hypothetical protein